MSRCLVIACIVMLALPAVVEAQDIPQAQERGPGTHYKMFTIEFAPGKTDDALSVLYDHLVPAWESAGVEIQVIEHLLQTRDVTLLIELEDGPAALAYEVPAQDARAWSALVQAAGGAEAAEKAVDRLIGFVARQSESLVFVRDR